MKNIEEKDIGPEVRAVYERLKQGIGREEVTEQNVHQLMKLAERDGHPVLYEELREWGAAC